jgi:Zn-dependent protease with chaperone function
MFKLAFAVLLLPAIILAQALQEADMMIGFRAHQQIAATWLFISQGDWYETIVRVSDRLASASELQRGGPRPQVFFLDDVEVNAFSTGGGRVYVTRGLMAITQGNEGILAFVLGHEMAHNALQHGAKAYLRRIEYEANSYRFDRQCRAGDKGACAALLVSQISNPLIEKKLQRNAEHEADLLGLRVAVEAGYHPDYALLAERRLHAILREQSKFAAFFSTHPRWTTREQRVEDNYDMAVARFNSRWASIDASPGGRPPALASLTEIKVQDAGRTKTVRTGVRIRNLSRQSAVLVATLVGDRIPDPEPVFERTYSTDQQDVELVSFQIPKDILKRRKGKQFITVIVRSNGSILGEAKPAKVK